MNNPSSATKVTVSKRSWCVERARDIVRLGRNVVPKGTQVVVIVCDHLNGFIGVSTNGGPIPTDVILQNTLEVRDRVIHSESGEQKP